MSPRQGTDYPPCRDLETIEFRDNSSVEGTFLQNTLLFYGACSSTMSSFGSKRKARVVKVLDDEESTAPASSDSNGGDSVAGKSYAPLITIFG